MEHPGDPRTSPATRQPAGDTRAILDALSRIEQRLDRVEAIASAARADAASALAGATDTFDHAMRAAAARGIDVDERARIALRLLERITQPDTMRALERVLELAEQSPAAIAMAADTLDSLAARVQQAGIDLDARADNVLRAAERLSSDRAVALIEASLERADAIRSVIESGALDPAAVAVVSKAGRALAEAASEPGASLGALGLLRAMSDAEIRAANGFLVRFARHLGRALADDAPALPTHANGARR
ncbi:DUF1641 domain-containing protein [Sandaracinus amylolyticus]|uniref:DUF1641 domain-containing protein n=1 Tax=Sandaracinus amylolyticus TaxID=927083 RepID=UPI001F48EC74|nr:DUF1641 domain-containing protein [Sandaracinus amylolyticus]UJR84515.1 Hypothetical protein I5071_65940 [Sandaracinus amylolyticus]